MSPRHAAQSERGATAVVVALALVVLIAMLGLVLNAGHLISVRGEIQNAVDSAAIAGAMELNGTSAGLGVARTSATNFALRHVTDSSPTEQVNPDVIQFGHWTRATTASAGTFEVITGTDTLSAWRINAVRVEAGQPESVFFGAFLNRFATDVAASAIAVAGGLSEVECADMPFVLREGCVAGRCPNPASDPEYSGGYYIVELSSDTMDSAGTTNLLPTATVSSALICEILQNPKYCEDHGYPSLTEGDVIGTANGAQWGANCGSDSDGETADDGKICEIISNRVGDRAIIPIIRYPTELETQCDGKYVADDAIIRGFGTIVPVFVQCSKDATPTVAPSVAGMVDQFQSECYPPKDPADTKPASGPQTCVVLEYRCNAEETRNSKPGGEWFGTSTVLPWLVR